MAKQLNKKTLLLTSFIFVISYLIFLLLWLQAKEHYNYAVTVTASKITAGIKNIDLDRLIQEKDTIKIIFDLGTKKIGIAVKSSPYIYNAPLTFAILAALYLFIKRKKRAYAEGILMLLFVHIFYITTFEVKLLTEIFAAKGFEAENHLKLFIYQFVWLFTENMVIRFEPFLLGFYLFVRFKKQED